MTYIPVTAFTAAELGLLCSLFLRPWADRGFFRHNDGSIIRRSKIKLYSTVGLRAVKLFDSEHGFLLLLVNFQLLHLRLKWLSELLYLSLHGIVGDFYVFTFLRERKIRLSLVINSSNVDKGLLNSFYRILSSANITFVYCLLDEVFTLPRLLLYLDWDSIAFLLNSWHEFQRHDVDLFLLLLHPVVFNPQKPQLL